MSIYHHTECMPISPSAAPIIGPPIWTWPELLATEPELSYLARVVEAATIPTAPPHYGRVLLAIERHIDWLAGQGRLDRRQADVAYRHLARVVADRVEVSP